MTCSAAVLHLVSQRAFLVQWGSLLFHKKSLANLAEAMKRTRKLCAVMVDSVGRELIINRPTQDDEDGWPTFEAGIAVEANQKASSLSNPDHMPYGTALSGVKADAGCHCGHTCHSAESKGYAWEAHASGELLQVTTASLWTWIWRSSPGLVVCPNITQAWCSGSPAQA